MPGNYQRLYPLGRVKNAVIFAFTSKYGLAVYELVAARINLKHMWQEEFTVADFRALVGVPDGKLERIPNLLQRVIQPAVLEVNGLADFGVKIEPIRKGGSMRGLVTGFACHGGARTYLIYKPPTANSSGRKWAAPPVCVAWLKQRPLGQCPLPYSKRLMRRSPRCAERERRILTSSSHEKRGVAAQ